ncbi:MAG TPA: pitrilysin family protein [Steroidobacteraceae bacterium]|nr:pitrilysin family protein [Steroidobacteraceae bacterium]
MLKRQLGGALFLVLFTGMLLAAAPAPQKFTEVEGITEYRLANGLRVLLFPDQSKPSVTVNVTYLVGSRHEGYGETGMAHLLEHLLFKGTRNLPDIAKEFNGRGMRWNGTTSVDRTNYYEQFQASQENLDWALKMEADRMVNALVRREDLDTEMTVVRNEYERGENSPTNVLVKRLQSIAYDWHNYGNSTIGNRSDIENVEIENLRAFYRRYYQPDNAVLLVAGKFDPGSTLQRINTYFGAIPKPTRVLPKLWTTEPTQDGERSFIVRRAGDTQIVLLAYKSPSPLHPDSAALDYASFVLGDTPSGRLHKALVQTGRASQVLGGSVGGVDGTLQLIGAVIKNGDPVEPVRDELVRQVEGFAANPPTAEEMERARINFANSAERMMTDHEDIGLAMSEYIALGDWRLFFLDRDRSQQVTAGQVSAAAGRYLRRDNRVVGMFLHEDNPQRAEIPQAASAAELLKDFKPKQALAAAEAFDPSPENIEQRVKRLESGGMKLALLSKKTRGETVQFRLSLPAGDEKSLNGQSFAGMLAGAMLSRGTTRYSREQLRDEFTRLKVAGGVSGQGASFETTRPNLVAAIRLVAHVLREPAFPESEFEQLKRQVITQVESSLSEPSSLASEALGQHFNIYPKGDPRYAYTLQEQLEGLRAVTLDDVRRFHRAFYAANRAMFAIVGDFDEAEVVKAIEESFGDWRNDTPWARITREYRDIPAKVQSIETPDKENAVLVARLNIDVNQSDADYAALYLADYILGSGAGFDSRLVARIRVKEGLSYSVGSQAAGSIFDRAGTWTAQAIAAPQNVDKVEAALRDELARALRDGFTAEEVAKAKSGFIQTYADTRTQDGSLASRLLAHLDSGRTLLTWDKAFEQRVLAATPEQIRAALRKHVDPAKLTIVKAGDFARARTEP